MNTRIALTASALVTLVAASYAESGTFASFFDTGASTFVRTPTIGNFGLLTATGTGYTLQTAGGTTYTDVAFKLNAPVTYQAAGSSAQAGALTGPGSFSFTKGATTLLTISFDTASLNSSGLHASFNNGGEDDIVRFGGSMIGSAVTVADSQGFDFSFANGQPVSGGGYRYSSAFSASGNFQPVPEPATMAVLGMGALAMIRRRRR